METPGVNVCANAIVETCLQNCPMFSLDTIPGELSLIFLNKSSRIWMVLGEVKRHVRAVESLPREKNISAATEMAELV
jgi:hypothetical protein